MAAQSRLDANRMDFNERASHPMTFFLPMCRCSVQQACDVKVLMMMFQQLPHGR